jgi:putative transposon-encoded protein
MRRTLVKEAEELTVRGIEGFFEKVVSPFGNGAKIDCPRQYMGRAVYVVIRRPEAVVGETAARRRRATRRGSDRSLG